MVTASHNPPQDNGYKVYLGDGSQIVPPADAEIAARIAAVGALAGIPRGDAGTVLGEHIVDRYLDTVAELAEDGPRDLDVVYTPLHGVGGTSVVQVLETAGFSPPRVVEQQEQPDPDFPTVAFPNPEEPGAMDLAMALAEKHGADLVVANDPDADRCAAAIPDRSRLADAARRRGRRTARPPPDVPRPDRAPGRPRSSPPPCSAGWRRPPASPTSRRSPASSGSAGSRGWRSATRRRSATASTPSTCGTRTGSRRCCCCASWPPRPRPRAAPWSTCSTTSPSSTACTPPTRSPCGSTTWR